MTIQILDKKFSPYLSEAQIHEAVLRVGKALTAELSDSRPLFVCILRGALFFFADLLEELHFSFDLAFYRVSSYEGTQSSHQVREQMPFPRNVKGRTVVLVEDIVETGETMEFLLQKFREMGAHEVRVATLLLKPGKFHQQFPIHYCGFSIGDEFIVGYGLDYRQEGRNLPQIYRIEE